MTNEEISKVKELLIPTKKIVIVPHKGPDGDAMGSTLALKILLEEQGHYVHLIAPNDYPDFLKWMPYQEEVLIYDKEREKCDTIIAEADVIFTLDFNHLSRTGEMQKILEEAGASFIMIDHHQQPDDYAEITYSDVTICSTCQMVYHFIVNIGLKEKITPQIATCLYTGIMTDTGSFRHPSTSKNVHLIIADLLLERLVLAPPQVLDGGVGREQGRHAVAAARAAGPLAEVCSLLARGLADRETPLLLASVQLAASFTALSVTMQVNAGGVSGTFGSELLPALAGDLVWNLAYTANSVVLQVAAPGLAGSKLPGSAGLVVGAGATG